MNRTGIAVSRREAIEALGVRYTHSGRAGTPVRERLGAFGVPEDPMNPVVTFATDEEALHYAVELTRDTARKETLEASLELEAFRGSWRVWLARHWDPARRWFNQDLAAVSILERRIAAAGKLVAGASFVSIERLDDTICIPATLAVGTTVFAVDTSAFPNRPVTLQPMVISEVHYLETPGHPLFHVVPRYKIEGMQGYYAYDHAESDEEVLASPSARGPTMYLEEGAAQARVSMFVNAVRDMLDRGAQPAIMLPPPTPMAAIEMNSVAPMDRITDRSDMAADERAEPSLELIEVPREVAPEDAIEVSYEVHEDAVDVAASVMTVVENETIAQPSEPAEMSQGAEGAEVPVPAGEFHQVVPEALPEAQQVSHVEEVRQEDVSSASEIHPTDFLPPIQPEDRSLIVGQPAAAGKQNRGFSTLLRLIGGRKSSADDQSVRANERVAIEPGEEIDVAPGEFARFAANGVKIRRWDNADGRESLARIALETLA